MDVEQGLPPIWAKLAVGFGQTWSYSVLTEHVHLICEKDPQAVISSFPKAAAKCFLDEATVWKYGS